MRDGRDVLEDVVFAVLEDLGLKVQVGTWLRERRGDLEDYVRASKDITSVSAYLVYVLCKNLSVLVVSDVLENEIGGSKGWP